jgi:hypothetical protein
MHNPTYKNEDLEMTGQTDNNDLETAQWMLENGYILDAELFRVAAALKEARERREKDDEQRQTPI